MSVSIDIDKVVKKYGDTVVVNGLSVDIMPGEFFTLLGPSGCGKTTLLRMIIGFNSIEGGTISVDGNVINDVATDKRNIMWLSVCGCGRCLKRKSKSGWIKS